MTTEKTRIKQVLAKNIKKCRKRLGFTQDEASERGEIPLKYWQRLELESQTDLPSLPTLFKIAKALKVAPSKLLELN